MGTVARANRTDGGLRFLVNKTAANLKSPSRKERLNETPHLSIYAQFQQLGQKDCFIHHIIGFLDVNKNC